MSRPHKGHLALYFYIYSYIYVHLFIRDRFEGVVTRRLGHGSISENPIWVTFRVAKKW